jgi:hypothetical protein
VELRPAFDPTTFTPRGQTYSVKSGEKGDFAIAAAPADLAMMVTLEGYAQEDPYSRPVSLKIDSPLPPATVRMVRGATVSGTIEDDDEKPIAGINVELIDSVSIARSATLRKTTGNDGKFTFTSVAPGNYFLRGVVQQRLVVAPGQSRTDSPAPQYAPTYYPGSIDGAGAASIPVYSGIDVPNLRLRMRKAEFYSVGGIVVGRESNAARAVSVRLQRKEDPRILMPTSLRNCRFRLPLQRMERSASTASCPVPMPQTFKPISHASSSLWLHWILSSRIATLRI